MTPNTSAHPSVDGREVLARATPLPWMVQDGCSWRRIGTRDGDGNVLCPTNHHRDGHPDLMAGRGEDTMANLRLIVAAVNAYPDYLDRLASTAALQERIAELESRLAACEQTVNLAEETD